MRVTADLGRCITVALVFALGLFNVGSGAAATGTKQGTRTVIIESTKFEPATLRVRRGDTVVWINKDPFPHTATGTPGTFDSRNIGPDRSWKYVPKKAGTFSYRCTLHPTMVGTLIVD